MANLFCNHQNNHIGGAGCPYCAECHSPTTTEFIIQAKYIHGDRYDYSEVIYINNHTKIQIKCKRHNEWFLQKPNGHLNGHGCPTCAISNTTSKPETQWLDSKRISKKNRNVWIVIGEKKYWVDAYIPRSKTIYEFYGDYWHGNPAIYKSSETNKRSKITYGKLYDTTIKREEELKAAGYKVVSIWEYDWKQQQRRKRK